MRIFASDKVSEIMKKLGMEDGEAIEHKWVSNLSKTHKKELRHTTLIYVKPPRIR